MRNGLSATITAALLAIIAALPATRAPAQRPQPQAQILRLFVSANGLDSNPCTLAQPCRTFQGAVGRLEIGGEIHVLDAADYGSFTIIDKPPAVSIYGHGMARISGMFGYGIGINAGNTAVSLNGLIIDGNGVGGIGIDARARSLVVENCIVRNMTANGLNFSNSATTTTPFSVSVSNSYFTLNGGNAILVATEGAGAVTATIDRVEIYGSGDEGLIVYGKVGTGLLNVAVTDSVSANNANAGFLVQSDAGKSISNLVLTRSTAVGNGIGVQALGPNAWLTVGQSTVTGNATGYSGGNIVTFGDNYIVDNSSNVGTLTSLGKQ